mmetsp:Transcript_5282/g.21323  ORF Transcript_5282/g.21323 Transcript_5282/m.21323 type:complete len:298 (+) Transcript_5282:178-1071(+)
MTAPMSTTPSSSAASSSKWSKWSNTMSSSTHPSPNPNPGDAASARAVSNIFRRASESESESASESPRASSSVASSSSFSSSSFSSAARAAEARFASASSPPRHSANAHVAAQDVGPVAGLPTADRVRLRFMRHRRLPPPRATYVAASAALGAANRSGCPLAPISFLNWNPACFPSRPAARSVLALAGSMRRPVEPVRPPPRPPEPAPRPPARDGRASASAETPAPPFFFPVPRSSLRDALPLIFFFSSFASFFSSFFFPALAEAPRPRTDALRPAASSSSLGSGGAGSPSMRYRRES